MTLSCFIKHRVLIGCFSPGEKPQINHLLVFFSPFIAPRVQPRPIITPRPAPKPKQVRTLDTLRLPTDSGGHSSQERMPQVCSSRSTHILILMVLPFRVRLAKWLINHLAAISEANRFVSRLGLRKAFRE